MSAQLQPDTGEILQAEADYEPTIPPLCVSEIQSPVRTQELPRKGGATRTRLVSDTKYIQLLENDPRRGSVVLISLDAEMAFGFSETSMQDPSAMTQWPKGVPCPLPVATEVWVICNEATKSTRISMATGLWAQG